MNENRWLSITCSRNDGDMVEAFIRGNSSFIDKFVIMDDSTDNTPQILALLSREGYDIEVIRRPGLVANQREKTNFMFQKYAKPKRFAAVIPLDVDEILVTNQKGLTKPDLGNPVEAKFLPWIPYAPKTQGWTTAIDSLQKCFVGTSNQLATIRKVYIPAQQISKNGIIEIGAHNFLLAGQPAVRGDHEGLSIAHFPVRTWEQIMSKVVTQLTAVRIKKNKLKGESTHLQGLARYLNSASNSQDLLSLQAIAAYYAAFTPESGKNLEKIQFNDLGKLLPNVSLRYLDYAKVNLDANLLKIIEELIELVMSAQGIAARDDKPYKFM
jgi:hypothetical protein